MLGKQSGGPDWYLLKKFFMVLQYMAQNPTTSQSPVWRIDTVLNSKQRIYITVSPHSLRYHKRAQKDCKRQKEFVCSSLFAEQELTRKELHTIKLAQSQASHGPSVDGRWTYLKKCVRRYWQLQLLGGISSFRDAVLERLPLLQQMAPYPFTYRQQSRRG